MIQDGNDLLFVNENGDWSSGLFIGGNRVEATGWGGLTGEVVSTSTGVQIQWANGTTWDEGQTELTNTWYADLTGDGQEDRIFRGVGNRILGVALLTGSGFSAPVAVGAGRGPYRTDRCSSTDLTGNGRDDLIYRGVDNRFWVSLSTGTGLSGTSASVGDQDPGPARRASVLCRPDGQTARKDMIFQGIDNRFWVSLWSRTGFLTPQLWATEGGTFVAGQVQFADLTGNGKDDMIFQGLNNQFWVSLATGTGFATSAPWATEAGLVPGWRSSVR